MNSQTHIMAWSKKLFMPGVEVHATEMLNLLQGKSPSSVWAEGPEALLLSSVVPQFLREVWFGCVRFFGSFRRPWPPLRLLGH